MQRIPRTKQDLKKFNTVEVSVMTHFHALDDGRLLESVQQVFPISLDEKLRTLLTWAVKEYGISYTLAMEAYLAEWFKALSTDREVQKDIRQAYAHLPEFQVSFSLQKQITWITEKP